MILHGPTISNPVKVYHFPFFHIAFIPRLLHNANVLILGLASLEGSLKKNADARAPMARWVAVAGTASWNNIIEVRQSLPTADAIKGTNLTCFNIGGNSFRLLTLISYNRQEIVICELMTHAEYCRKYVR